jgi:DNA-binding PadR family transcriptional regulator
MYLPKGDQMDFSKELIKGSVVPVILALLRERPMYGYEMVKLVNARTNGRLQWREGTLYPTLHKLEFDKLIRGEWKNVPTATEAPSGEGGERSRKYYALTRRGRGEFLRRSTEWQEFSDSISLLLQGGGK